LIQGIAFKVVGIRRGRKKLEKDLRSYVKFAKRIRENNFHDKKQRKISL
jgi:hypothetical protein